MYGPHNLCSVIGHAVLILNKLVVEVSNILCGSMTICRGETPVGDVPPLPRFTNGDFVGQILIKDRAKCVRKPKYMGSKGPKSAISRRSKVPNFQKFSKIFSLGASLVRMCFIVFEAM